MLDLIGIKNITLRGDCVIRNFPSEMKSKRLDLHMSMSELSKKTNISKRILYQYENGEVEPSTIRFLKICHALSIDPKDFIK